VNEERARAVSDLLGQGLPAREVARRTGASYSYCYVRAKRLGLLGGRGHANAEDHPWKRSRIGRAARD
jgi:transposase